MEKVFSYLDKQIKNALGKNNKKEAQEVKDILTVFITERRDQLLNIHNSLTRVIEKQKEQEANKDGD